MTQVVKIVIIGDSGVGKTNIMKRYVENVYEDTGSTIGVEFETKSVNIDGKDVKLQIWDTAGQERFRAISRTIYHNAKCVILVYDITRRDSFENVSMWLNESKINAPSSAHYILVGNKNDMEHIRDVSPEQGDAFARRQNMSFLETSAQDNVNIDRTFDFIINFIKIDKQDQEKKKYIIVPTKIPSVQPQQTQEPKSMCPC